MLKGTDPDLQLSLYNYIRSEEILPLGLGKGICYAYDLHAKL